MCFSQGSDSLKMPHGAGLRLRSTHFLCRGRAIRTRLRSADRKGRGSHADIVQGTGKALATLLQVVGIGHGGSYIVVPEQVLNGADVGAALQQVGGEGMTKTFGILLVPSRPTY